jgi:hypothetical protein
MRQRRHNSVAFPPAENSGSNCMMSEGEDPLEELIDDVQRSLLDRPSLSAWGGCAAQFAGEDPPAGWVRLSLSRSIMNKTNCARAEMLCPKHAKKLEGMLKGIPGPLGDIVHG